MVTDSKQLLDKIAQVVVDKRGFNTLAIDVRGLSSLTDYFLIAEGNVARHVQAIGEAIREALIELNIRPLRVEGVKDSEWVVYDYGEVMVHLFTSDLRDKYRLDQVWSEGQLVELHTTVPETGEDDEWEW